MSEAHDMDRPSDAHGARSSRAPRSDGVAVWALVLSVTVVFSLPAILVALVAVVRARSRGRAVPGAAIGAIAVSLVSLGMVVATVFAFGYRRTLDGLQAFFRVQAVSTRDPTTQQRYGSVLDAATACKLLEQQLSRSGFAGYKPEDFVTVHCNGELVASEDRARLTGVRAQFISGEIGVNGCFLRQRRWFVMGITRRECVQPLDLPQAPPPEATDAVLDKYENQVRKASEQARDAVAVQSVTQKLEIVKNAASELGALVVEPCDDAALKRLAGTDDVSLDTIDLGVYAPPGTAKPPRAPEADFDAGVAPDGGPLRPIPWHWMTSERMRRFESDNAKSKARAAREFDELEGSLLVVYRANSRDWPEFVPKWGPNHRYLYTKGSYDGWLILFDLERGAPLCQVRLKFASSDQVSPTRLGMMPETTGFAQMLDRDMHTNFQEAATAAFKRIAPSLTLGYMMMESP